MKKWYYTEAGPEGEGGGQIEGSVDPDPIHVHPHIHLKLIFMGNWTHFLNLGYRFWLVIFTYFLH